MEYGGKLRGCVMSPQIVNAGVDTLYLNVYYADPERLTRIDQPLDEKLQATFDDLQQRAKLTRQEVLTPWHLERQPFYMLSHGSGKQWRWIIKNDLLNVQIGNGDYRGIIGHIRVSSDYLWRVNALHHVLGRVNGFTNQLFGHETTLVPGDVDVCADIADLPMESLNPLGFVARARKHRSKYTDESTLISGEEEWNGRKLGTLYIGKRSSPIHAKLYDKVKEIKDGCNKKAWFFDIYERNGWDGQAPVTRLEVSFKREALRDMDIETGYDLRANLKGLWAYAVGSETVKSWLRYTIPTNDYTQTRWPLHPLWETVQHAFDSLSEEPARELIRFKKQQSNIEATTSSIMGYLSSRTVWQCDKYGVPVENMGLETAFADLYDEIEKKLLDKGVSFQQLLEAKQHRYYLREAKTREIELQHTQSFISENHQEGMTP
jgi:hypothetical protein